MIGLSFAGFLILVLAVTFLFVRTKGRHRLLSTPTSTFERRTTGLLTPDEARPTDDSPHGTFVRPKRHPDLIPPVRVRPLRRNEQFKLGHLLDSGGGQGSVHALAGDPNLVYKQYQRPLPGAAEAFRELIEAGDAVQRELGGEGVFAVWPKKACGRVDTVEGYIMPRIPPEFYIHLETPYGKKRTLATLDHALPPAPDATFRPTTEATARNRRELARLTGVFLDTLHRHDLVYGDLSFKNIAFTLNPTQVLFMDIDSVHHISTKLIKDKDLVTTRDWEDPECPHCPPLGFDLDRYKFALLVHRMLLNGGVSGSPKLNTVVPRQAEPSWVRRGEKELLSALVQRAVKGPRGARPPISEWLSALQ